MALALFGSILVVGTTPSGALTTVTLRVVIEEVRQQGCTDTLDGSDFYANILINGESFRHGRINDRDEIQPAWTTEKLLDPNRSSFARVSIEIKDYDRDLDFEDDVCDITAATPRWALALDVPLLPCSVTGDVSGACGTSLTTSGNGDRDGNASVRFRIEVDEPPSAPGLAVRCTHTPVWPQPGDDVTITVEALDGNEQVDSAYADGATTGGNVRLTSASAGFTADDVGKPVFGGSIPPGTTIATLVSATAVDLSAAPTATATGVTFTIADDGIDHSKIADSVEIWVGDRTAADLDQPNRSAASLVVDNVPAGDLLYGCRVRDEGGSAFTGWRRTRVGAPAEGKGVPVVYTGDRSSRVDIVFIADQDSYTSATDPAFLEDVNEVLRGAYFGQAYFLANQDKFNFWLADATGDADRVPNPADPPNPTCVLTPPTSWAADYSWRDSGAILHTDTLRDCAGNGVFSVEPTSLSVVLHETGHSPFGMADEYCCDGGYFEEAPNANMFDTLAECQADAPALSRTAADCRSITDSRPTPAEVWQLSEPNANDLMNDNGLPQAADIRRMDWFFAKCVAGHC